MPVKVIILEEADKEWTEAALWYEGQSPGLGNRFIEMVDKKLELIASYPERYPLQKENFRETLVPIFLTSLFIRTMMTNKKHQPTPMGTGCYRSRLEGL